MLHALILMAQESSSGASDLQVAFVGAAAGVAGALVGGVTTGIVTFKAETKRQSFAREQAEESIRREQERELAVVRGVARAHRNSFYETWMALRAAVRAGYWWSDEADVQTSIPLDDKKLLGSYLSAAEWDMMARADIALRRAISFRAITITEREADADLPPEPFPDFATGDHGSVVDAVRAVEGAINSLSEITGLEPPEPASAEELEEHSGPP